MHSLLHSVGVPLPQCCLVVGRRTKSSPLTERHLGDENLVSSPQLTPISPNQSYSSTYLSVHQQHSINVETNDFPNKMGVTHSHSARVVDAVGDSPCWCSLHSGVWH